ncbi:MAG: hypothetical protein ACRD1G_10335 [Acidimicrobiales bacterium]
MIEGDPFVALAAGLDNHGLAADPAGAGEMMESASLDALELELRLLPGVMAVGLEGESEQLTVQLLVASSEGTQDLRRRAAEVGRSHIDRPIYIEIEASVSRPEGRSGLVARNNRVRLLAVRVMDDQSEAEVHLAYGGARTVGRGPGDQGRGVVLATLEALEGLGASVAFEIAAVASLSLDAKQITVVVLSPADDGTDRLGVAKGATFAEAACRATLNALNRHLEAQASMAGRVFVDPVFVDPA